MDAASYEQYLQETGDWLKNARACLLGQLIEAHATRSEGLELLEVGAGAGQNLATLARFGTVDAIEVNERGREAILTRGIARDVFPEPVPFPLERRYDVVCALDVIEHLADDHEAIRWIGNLLQPGGLLIATVPAYQWLFSDHDRALGHFRRYTRPRLVATLSPEMEVATAGYFTHFAFPLAVASRALWSLRRASGSTVPAKQSSPRGGMVTAFLSGMQAFELALIRRGYRPPFGLSAYMVARKLSGNIR